MRRQLLTAIGMVVVMTVVCGFAYGLALTGLGQVAFPSQANGSIVQKDGKRRSVPLLEFAEARWRRIIRKTAWEKLLEGDDD